MKTKLCFSISFLVSIYMITIDQAKGQTSMDGVMMNKHQLCTGITYMKSSWTNYWEGTYKRNNDNIGKLTTQEFMLMSNYGITNDLNVMVGIPYITSKASKGTLHGMKGFQDASIDLKWKALKCNHQSNQFSLITDIGFSAPLSNYVIDFLPMSIGMGSTNLSGRIIADYQKGKFFSTASAGYAFRSNVKLDRTSYYTTSLHSTNEVEMPDVANYSISIGLRTPDLILETFADRFVTLGGFDIRKNDMPFVSNQMNFTAIGLSGKYFLPFNNHIEITANASTVINGRNTGAATSYGAGLFYVFTFKNKKIDLKKL